MKSPDDYRVDSAFGGEWEAKVASLLRRCNPYLEQPKKFNAEVNGELIGFPDDGDLRASVVLGIKRRKISFTCREDYPFKTVFIDEEYKMIPDYMNKDSYYALSTDHKRSRLRWFHSYWIGSQDMSHVALILPATKRHWVLEPVYSKRDVRWATNWACPKEKVLFGRAEDIPSLLTWT